MANRVITACCADETMQLSSSIAGAAGSSNAVTLRLSFSPVWDGTTKKVYFYDATKAQSVCIICTTDKLVSGEADMYDIPIPAEALDVAGKLLLTVKGVVVSGNAAERVMVSATATMDVLDADIPSGDNTPVEPNATQAEQLQTEIDDIKSTVTNAYASATAAANSATASATSATAAETAKTAAEAAKTSAENTASTFDTHASSVTTTFDNNATAKTTAFNDNATAANATIDGKVTTATNAATAAEAAQAASESARDSAISAKTDAQTAETNAGTYSTSAGNSATAAAGSATDAQGYANSILYDIDGGGAQDVGQIILDGGSANG